MKKPDFEFEKDKRYLVTGIGSSEAHAKYLEHIGNDNKFNMKFLFYFNILLFACVFS